MRHATLVALSIIMLKQSVQADWASGSGDSGDPVTAPKCVATETHPYCTIIRSTAELFVVNTNHIEDIFATLQEGAANSSYICSQFIIFSACFYSYRECDAKGTQKLICPEVCPLITELYKDCVKSHVVNKLLHSTSIAEVRDFLLFSLSFNCSASNTYEVKGVSVSDESCQDLKFIYTLFPDKATEGTSEGTAKSEGTSEQGFPNKVNTALGVGIPLLIIVLIVSLVVLFVVILKLYKSKTKLERRITERIPFKNEYNPHIEAIITQGVEDEKLQLSAEERCFYEERFDRALISHDQLEIAETIGEGTFGVVCKAKFLRDSHCQPVAVKKARNLSTKQQLRSLLNESLLMKRFEHPNVVGLLGVCFDTPEGYPYLILPFMANGNVRDYLKTKRVHATDTVSLPDGVTVKMLLTMCLDVARGMEYLSSIKFVHRDLAARNCMMDDEGVVKVGDFGLARDVYAHLYYRGDKHSEIPVKWSAPEMLTDSISTEMSDVWSFGVVCWEVFSLGAVPYPGVSNYDIPHYIMSGRRLPCPPLCPQNMYVLMENCWSIKPEARPTFKDLASSMFDTFHD